jgi:PAS domain S-box-containing protein
MGDFDLPSNVAVSDTVMIVARSDGAIVHVTDAYCEMVGKERDELVGHRADQAGVAGSAERMQWILDRIPSPGSGISYRRVFDTPTGPRLFDAHLHAIESELIVTVLDEVTSESADDDTGGAVLVPGRGSGRRRRLRP